MENPQLRLPGVSVDIEVRGEFQGLYFLNHCKEEAFRLGVLGWVKHDKRGTIVGIIQGRKSKVEQMISWLHNRGSPGSRVDNCFLYNYRFISRPEYRTFSIRL